VTEDKCILRLLREGGADGKISCNYRTVELKSNPRSAHAGADFLLTEGKVEWDHTVTEA